MYLSDHQTINIESSGGVHTPYIIEIFELFWGNKAAQAREGLYNWNEIGEEEWEINWASFKFQINEGIMKMFCSTCEWDWEFKWI